VNDRILKSLMAGIQELTNEPGVGPGATFSYYDQEQKCLVVLARGDEVEVRQRVIENLRADLEQFSVKGLVQIRIQGHAPNSGAVSAPSVFAVVELASSPPLTPLSDVIAQQLTKCLVELGPERTARGRFGLLILGIDGDGPRAAEVKEATDKMIDRYRDLAGKLSTCASGRLWVMFYDNRNQKFDEYAAPASGHNPNTVQRIITMVGARPVTSERVFSGEFWRL